MHDERKGMHGTAGWMTATPLHRPPYRPPLGHRASTAVSPPVHLVLALPVHRCFVWLVHRRFETPMHRRFETTMHRCIEAITTPKQRASLSGVPAPPQHYRPGDRPFRAFDERRLELGVE